MEIYETVLSLLGLSDDDLDKDKVRQIKMIIEVVSDRLISKLSSMMGVVVDDVPEELDTIVVEISVTRYNRIGSEGSAAHTVDGETFSWTDTDYFAPYEDDINSYVKAQGHSSGVQFL